MITFISVVLIICTTLSYPPPEPKNEIIHARVTAYAPFDNVSGICNDGDPNYTSTGVRPGFKYAAVDPSRIPYGTIFFVPGYGIVEAADTGGALRNAEHVAIDVYFDTYVEAIEWGARWLDVEIIKYP